MYDTSPPSSFTVKGFDHRLMIATVAPLALPLLGSDRPDVVDDTFEGKVGNLSTFAKMLIFAHDRRPCAMSRQGSPSIGLALARPRGSLRRDTVLA